MGNLGTGEYRTTGGATLKTAKDILALLGLLLLGWVILAFYEAIQASGGLHIVAGH